ncbi:HK97 gp10 family phage protein, partial [Streptococcus pneumoniae]|nr:HK97 gp10 family phage protein [Streptococcus pneumoniae]
MSELLGADRLIAKCRRLASKKTGEDIVLRAVHNATIKVVQADARRLAPARDGELIISIKTRAKMDG